MATSKAKKAKKSNAAKSKPTTSKPKTTAAKVDKKTTVVAEKTEAKNKTESKKEEVKVITAKKPSAVKEFFSRKFDASENILTIFKDTHIIGALIGEILGVALITMVALTLGQPDCNCRYARHSSHERNSWCTIPHCTGTWRMGWLCRN